MCGGDGTAMCGEPRVATECTCTEREFSRCSRPTVRPGRTANDERDHGDGSDTRPRGYPTSGSLTETRVRDWQYWPERVGGPDHEPMRAGRDRPAGQNRPRRVRRARRTGRRRWRSVFETYVNASKSNQLPRNGLMSGSRKAVWKESVRRGRRPPWRSR